MAYKLLVSKEAVTASGYRTIPSYISDFHERENSMDKVNVGVTFSTRNSTVAKLPVDSILRVSASGELEVLEVPFSAPLAGERFTSKHGPATVVRPTSRTEALIDVINGDSDGFLYVADGTSVVRVSQ